MPSKIKILNNDIILEVKEGETLLECLRKNKVNIRSSCGGHATCSDCVIKIADGENRLTKTNFDEKKLLGNVYFITKERLACQTKFLSNTSEGESIDQVQIEIVNLDN